MYYRTHKYCSWSQYWYPLSKNMRRKHQENIISLKKNIMQCDFHEDLTQVNEAKVI